MVPVISGRTRFQPVYVGDVADAVMAGLTRLPDLRVLVGLVYQRR